MSDKISSMPNNGENFFRLGMNALQDNDIELGLEYLLKSYDLEPIISTFAELVTLYIAMNRTEELDKLWNESGYDLDEISHSSILTKLYANSLPLLTHRLNRTLELYMMRDAQSHPEIIDLINEMIQAVHSQDKIKNELSSMNEEDLKSYISQFTDRTMIEILQQLKDLYHFPTKDLLHFYKGLLTTPDLANFIKSDILHHLLFNDISGEVSLVWFNQHRQVDLIHLVPYREHDFFKDSLAHIEDDYGKEDPHLLSNRQEIFYLFTMILYPFLEEGFQDIDTWLKYMDTGLNLTDNSYYEKAMEELNNIYNNN